MTLSIDVDILEDAALPADARLKQLPQLIRYVLEAECATGEWTVSVLLTNDSVLRQLHRDFMGIDTETDVMTFPFGENLGKPEKGGEIAISVDTSDRPGARVRLQHLGRNSISRRTRHTALDWVGRHYRRFA